MYDEENTSNDHKMSSGFDGTYTDTNGLDCLKMVDSLYIKQQTSLSESIFEKS
jgi:hypothetical protein